MILLYLRIKDIGKQYINRSWVRSHYKYLRFSRQRDKLAGSKETDSSRIQGKLSRTLEQTYPYTSKYLQIRKNKKK